MPTRHGSLEVPIWNGGRGTAAIVALALHPQPGRSRGAACPIACTAPRGASDLGRVSRPLWGRRSDALRSPSEVSLTLLRLSALGPLPLLDDLFGAQLLGDLLILESLRRAQDDGGAEDESTRGRATPGPAFQGLPFFVVGNRVIARASLEAGPMAFVVLFSVILLPIGFLEEISIGTADNRSIVPPVYFFSSGTRGGGGCGGNSFSGRARGFRRRLPPSMSPEPMIAVK